jgi:phospho-N-acetylmuramoyl-pentapeptide-transferase
VVKKRSLGLTARKKLLAQFAVGLAVGLAVYFLPRSSRASTRRVAFPFFKQIVPDLGILYVPSSSSSSPSSSNAVNLTDGLDGLAIGTTLVAAAAFTGARLRLRHARFADYLDLLFRSGDRRADRLLRGPGGGVDRLPLVELLPGPGLHGRRGRLALGGALGTVAVLIKQELLLFVVGGCSWSRPSR